ncbi:hypothetical protein [Thalassotalea agariperforans]
MTTISNYLYQYPQSKQFYFRIRIPREISRKLCINAFTLSGELKKYQ